MDHFARPDDELAIAQREGTLYRNFQGYSTHANCDLVAMGATAIGMVGPSYSQNLRDIGAYGESVDAGHIPVFRGVTLTEDDLIRRNVITQLICNLRLSIAAVEERFGIDFPNYFADEVASLRAMEDDGLLEVTDQALSVLAPGRLLIRNICMVFDRYLRVDSPGRYSKVI
jgi:oxygen-independent coproporphyrinogen-3 oxidase